MLLKSSAKVGVVVMLALVLGYVMYSQLAHIRTNSYTVKLNVTDTQGLSSQSIVRMEGVAVGEVASVDLDKNNQPLIYLAIKRKYKIPKSFTFKITSGILITQAQVSIVAPAAKPGQTAKAYPPGFIPTDGTAVVIGGAPPSGILEAVDPELHETFAKLNQTFTIITDRFNDASGKIAVVLDETRKLMATANNIAGSANSFVSNPRLKQDLLASLDNFRATTDDAHMMTTELRRDLDDLVGSSKGNLKDLTTKLNGLFDAVDATIQDTDTVVKKFTEQVTDPHLQQSLQETAELARATLARFNQLASDIHTLTGDPEMQGDIKRIVANLGTITDNGQHLMSAASKFVDKVTGKSQVPKFPKINLIANASEQLSPTRLRVDFDAIAPFGARGLFDLGLYDIGQNTRLTAEGGTRFGDKFDVRYGLYASKIGAGMDYYSDPGTGLRFDLYNTNRPELDGRVLLRVNKNASLWIGSDNLLRTPIPMIGVQVTQ